MSKRGPLLAFLLGGGITLILFAQIFLADGDPDFGLHSTKAMLAIAVLAAIVLPLINAMEEPKSMLKSLMGLGVAGLLFMISYGISGDEVTAVYAEFDVDAGTSKLVGGGIIMTYLLAVIAVGGIVYSEVSRMFK